MCELLIIVENKNYLHLFFTDKLVLNGESTLGEVNNCFVHRLYLCVYMTCMCMCVKQLFIFCERLLKPSPLHCNVMCELISINYSLAYTCTHTMYVTVF